MAGGSRCVARVADRRSRCVTGRPPGSGRVAWAPASPVDRCATSALRTRSRPTKIIACEVITPAGNWSSYPAHKHDEASETESELEEIYYFEIAAGPDGQPGFGFMRTSSSPGHEIEVLEEVHDRRRRLGAVRLARPLCRGAGFDMYYLNVMAGPSAERAWKITDHPDQTWVRGTWETQDVDPRLLRHPTGPFRRLDVTASNDPTHRGASAGEVPRCAIHRSDGVEQKLFAGCFGIFGHGNVAGIGQALLQAETGRAGTPCPTSWVATSRRWCIRPSRYARMKIGCKPMPLRHVWAGSDNMLTGAALATINRLPVLLLPADTFADRAASPLLQELELPYSGDITVNDAFRPVQQYFDRIWRPEQLPAALLSAMRVLTDPAETGAVTSAFPRTCRRRRTTGRPSCSPSGSGMWPGRFRSDHGYRPSRDISRRNGR